MKSYRVGGCVRDRLLGRYHAELKTGDVDHVVVGATQDEMESLGFKAIGKDFPVFLHPDSGEEYALARTERKAGRGYRGFVVDTDPSVTLEQYRARRDCTINAMAEDDDGNVIDPYGGQRDIEQRWLRHVSDAFAEDPVRILRAARFLARFAPLGFHLHPDTAKLMCGMVADGEVDHLVPERVWKELSRALTEAAPQAFVQCLREVGALARILPEVDALYGVPQRAEFHPEVDTGIHIELVMEQAARIAPGNAMIGFAALTHDLGKALTPEDELPRHVLHEQRGLKPLDALCQRLKVPTDYRKLARAACREHLNIHRIDQLKPATLHDLIARCDGFRNPQLIRDMAVVCEADKRGRKGLSDSNYPQGEKLVAALDAMLQINARDLDFGGRPLSEIGGEAIGAALRRARIAAIVRPPPGDAKTP